jgi:hypothetical protein
LGKPFRAVFSTVFVPRLDLAAGVLTAAAPVLARPSGPLERPHAELAGTGRGQACRLFMEAGVGDHGGATAVTTRVGARGDRSLPAVQRPNPHAGAADLERQVPNGRLSVKSVRPAAHVSSPKAPVRRIRVLS